MSNSQWLKISSVVCWLFSLHTRRELHHCQPHPVRGQVGLGSVREALWVSQGSSACMIESLARALCVYPGTEAGRKFKGKYIFYAVQSKSISPLSQPFAPVSIECLGRARLLRNLRSKGCTGWCQGQQESALWLPGTACPWGLALAESKDLSAAP